MDRRKQDWTGRYGAGLDETGHKKTENTGWDGAVQRDWAVLNEMDQEKTGREGREQSGTRLHGMGLKRVGLDGRLRNSIGQY